MIEGIIALIHREEAATSAYVYDQMFRENCHFSYALRKHILGVYLTNCDGNVSWRILFKKV